MKYQTLDLGANGIAIVFGTDKIDARYIVRGMIRADADKLVAMANLGLSTFSADPDELTRARKAAEVFA